MHNANRYFLYARRSDDSEDRQVYSIEHQLADMREAACKRNLEIVAELTESRSAKYPGRPVFNEMMRRVKSGEASGIIAWSPDRLARNFIDGGQILHLLDTDVIHDLQFYNHTFECTAGGKLMLTVLFGMSKYHVDAMSEGIKRNIRRRILAGYWPKRAPLGYLFDHHTRTDFPDPVRAPLIRKTFELYGTGNYTLDQLRHAINTVGLTGFANKHHKPLPLSRSQYQRILQDPFYVGIMRLKGDLYDGQHEPLISTHLFDTCQIVMAQRGRTRVAPKPFLYRGLFKCTECGCSITSEMHKGTTYLRCTKRRVPCSQCYLREDDATKQIHSIIKSMIIPQEIIDMMVARLEEEQTKDAASWIADIASFKQKIEVSDQKLQRLTNVYVDGGTALNDYKTVKEKLIKQKRKYLESLAFLEKNRKARFDPSIRFIRGLIEPQTAAAGDDKLKQRDFLRKVGSNFFIKDGHITWEARGPWKHVAELGRLAQRGTRPPVPATAAHGKIPSLCTSPQVVRCAFDLHTFIKENPAWV